MKHKMMAANQKQIEMKAIKAREAAAEEERARADMLAKFAEDDRIEQMNAQKRRMKQIEHKREVCTACMHLVAIGRCTRARGASCMQLCCCGLLMNTARSGQSQGTWCMHCIFHVVQL
jgi:hypothetical protein